MEHAQMIESAFAAYLQGLGATYWPASLSAIYPGETNLEKDGQNIVAWVDGDSENEDPPLSGNRWFDTIIRLRTPVVQDNGVSLANHQNAAAALQTAILSTTLPDQLTAAIANFQCFGLGERTPFREQDEDAWTSGWKVRLYSCPSAIAA